MNENEQFLKDLANDQGDIDILTAPLIPEDGKGENQQTQENEQGDEQGQQQQAKDGANTSSGEDDDGNFGGDFQPRTRRERRLMRKLTDERESSIFLAGRLQAREEARTTLNEEGEYLKSIERIYGTETPEAQLATELLKKAIVGARDDAEERAYQRIQAERKREAEEFAAAQDELDDYIEEIEDTYKVRLTQPQETAFFQLLKKMSPKDKQGNVTGYADPHAVWEVFQERIKRNPSRTVTRAKELSDRSMTQSGASKESTLQNDSTTRFLAQNGII